MKNVKNLFKGRRSTHSVDTPTKFPAGEASGDDDVSPPQQRDPPQRSSSHTGFHLLKRNSPASNQAGGSADHATGKKPGKGIFGGKSKGKGKDHADDAGSLREELDAKEHELSAVRAELEETRRKAEEWKEFSNMQQFKTEVLVDMWVMRMVNGDGRLEHLPLPEIK